MQEPALEVQEPALGVQEPALGVQELVRGVQEPALQVRGFDPSAPKAAVLLSYQRCGSTFVGGIFNQNDEAFYMFEPVDGVYSAMYGTPPGYNVPSDIYAYWNGTYR